MTHPKILGPFVRVAAPITLFLAVLFGYPAGASAQVMQNLGPAPVLAGVQVGCAGIPAYVANIPDLALAQPGAILLRPDFFALPAVVQLFVYAHECAHLVAVGPDEAAADCWAVQLGRNQGWLDQGGLEIVARHSVGSPGDWTHAPGPLRVRRMWQCF